jgi:ABC-type spermidine/putrescine transport system permease subunit I
VSRSPRLDFWSGVLMVAFAVVAVLMVWPLYSIFTASVIDNRSGAWTFANFAQILGHPAYRTALVNSLIVGTGGMIGAMLLGIPLAVLTTRFVIAGRSALATLSVLALVSPPFIGAYAWIMMLGSNGWMRALLADVGIVPPPIYGMFGILLAFSLKFYPFVFLLTASGLGAISPSVEEAAESLGAGPWRRFFKVTLPLVFPAVSSGALLAFVLDRGFRHTLHRRWQGAIAGDHRVRPFHRRNGRQSGARLGHQRRPARRVLDGGRVAALGGAPARHRGIAVAPSRATAAGTGRLGGRACRLLRDRAGGLAALDGRDLYVVPQDERAGVPSRLRVAKL